MSNQPGNVDELESTEASAASIGLNKFGIVKWVLSKVRERSVLALLAILIVGFGSFLKFVAIPGTAGKLFELAAKNHRLDIQVENWSVGLISGTITANNVRWMGKGKFTHDELFLADSITANVSHGAFVPLIGSELISSIESIVINDPTVYIENKNSGRWNWESAMSARKLNSQIKSIKKMVSAGAQDVSGFDISSIEAKDLKITWVEHLQAKSGNGRIQQLTSTLNIDEAELVLSDIMGWFQQEEQPIQIDFDGRTADGVIKASGEINPFWLVGESGNGFQQVGWMPSVDGLSVYVENVSTEAFGQMVPDSLFQPVSGKMTGQIVFGLNRKGVTNYDVEMEYDNVKWAINERSTVYPTAFKNGEEKVETTSALNEYAKSGLIRTSSQGNVNDNEFRLIPSIQTSMTRKALADSPPILSARAAQDQFRFEDKNLSPVLAELQSISGTLKTINAVARQAGAVVRSTNAATRGLNQVKGALGNLFK